MNKVFKKGDKVLHSKSDSWLSQYGIITERSGNVYLVYWPEAGFEIWLPQNDLKLVPEPNQVMKEIL